MGAPTWEIEYDGDIAKRTATRQKMFDAIDGMHGPARGWIGCAQFIHWATNHVAAKVADAKAPSVDFYHVADYSKQDFLKAIDNAVHDPKSQDHQNFYEFLLTIFVEEDHQCKGVVSKEAFARLLTGPHLSLVISNLPPHLPMQPELLNFMLLWRIVAWAVSLSVSLCNGPLNTPRPKSRRTNSEDRDLKSPMVAFRNESSVSLGSFGTLLFVHEFNFAGSR